MHLPRKFRNLTDRGIVHLAMPLLVFVLLFAIAGGYFLIRSTHAAAANYVFKSGIAGKCLDDWHRVSANGTKVDLFTCNNTVAQEWNINSNGTVENANGKCLDNWQQKKTNGNPIKVYTCSAKDPAEQWRTTGSVLKNPQTGKCIDDPAFSATNGTQLILYTCNGGKNQRWVATLTSNKPTPTPVPSPSPTPSPTPTPTPAPTPTPTPSPTPTPTSSVSCDYQPDTWSGDASSVGYSVSKISATNGNPASFSVKLNAKRGTTEVVGYPSDQCILYSALPANLTSSFKDTPPANSSGLDYEYAYDIWLTTASAAKANNWNNDLELMIWNYVNGQVPAGSVKSTLSDGSKVWVDGNNVTGTVSVVLPKNETTGTVNISSIVSQLKAKGYVTSGDTGILDVEYGIEAPYGGGQTFSVNSMSVAE